AVAVVDVPVEAEEAPAKPKRTRTRKAAAEAPVAEAPVAAAPVAEVSAPVRQRRVPTRKPVATPIPDVVVDEAPAAPRRRTRKVAAPASEPQFQIAPPSEPVRTTRRFR
ncbi:hypothetical protein PL81_09225, partial [Streptomyces sp. RSD-27]